MFARVALQNRRGMLSQFLVPNICLPHVGFTWGLGLRTVYDPARVGCGKANPSRPGTNSLIKRGDMSNAKRFCPPVAHNWHNMPRMEWLHWTLTAPKHFPQLEDGRSQGHAVSLCFARVSGVIIVCRIEKCVGNRSLGMDARISKDWSYELDVEHVCLFTLT